MRIMEKASDKLSSKILPEKIQYLDQMYDDMADATLKYINRLIWDITPTTKPDILESKPVDSKGKTTGLTLTKAFNIGIDYAKSQKEFDNYIIELHWPNSIISKGLSWEKQNYEDQIAKGKDLAEVKTKPKSKKKVVKKEE
jgi:hypothetical protein